MSQFLSGAVVDCGPSNVLKNVGGRLDRDFSLHQDHLISQPNVAGPSSQPFRARVVPLSAQQRSHTATPTPFDLSALSEHLSPNQLQQHRNQSSHRPVVPAGNGWADAFVPTTLQSRQSSVQIPTKVHSSSWASDFYSQASRQPESTLRPLQSNHIHHLPWQHSAPSSLVALQPDPQHHQQLALTPHPQLFDARFDPGQYPSPMQPTTIWEQQAVRSSVPPLTESQEVLARAAMSFVDELNRQDHILASNPKLAQSKFLNLLKGLSEKEVVVKDGQQPLGAEDVGEGAKLVARAEMGHDRATSRVSGIDTVRNRHIPSNKYDQSHGSYTALLMTDPGYHALTASQASMQRRKSVHFDEAQLQAKSLGGGVPQSLEQAFAAPTTIPGSNNSWEETGEELDTGSDFDHEAFQAFNGEMRQTREPRIGIGAMEGWGELQRDWEEFQRTQPGQGGLRGMGVGDQTERYLFHRANPYNSRVIGLQDQRRESPTLKHGVLELESAVQNDPTDHEAWFALGLKQQENEREDQAILALSKVVQLDPEYRPAYLALAVSYTNDGELGAACQMLEKWIDLCEDSKKGITDEALSNGSNAQQRLVDRLINLARRNPELVDTDVQVALGVLFNASEQYQKAEDCFSAALSVRPDDWLLWNRLGATLANSGRSNEAITYYHKALSLHPNFVRALFNLGISYINLAQYTSAAQRILDALRLQKADATEGYSTSEPGPVRNAGRGVGSEALWTTLRNACLHMGRGDLVALAATKELGGFPMDLEDSA